MALAASEITPAWTLLPGKGVTIAVSDEGKFVCSNDEGSLYTGDGKGWMQMAGKATVITIGADGDMWCVNKDDNIYHWEERGWMEVPGAARYISCGNKNHIACVNREGNVYTWGAPGWNKLPGQLRTVSIASDGELWGCNEDDAVYRFDRAAKKWEKQAGKGVKLAVVRNGSVYLINREGHLYHMKDNEGKWRQQPGTLSHIETNSHGLLCGATNDDKLYLRPAADYDKKHEHKVLDILKSPSKVDPPVIGVRKVAEAKAEAKAVAAAVAHPFHNNKKYRLQACGGKNVRVQEDKVCNAHGEDGPLATFTAFVEGNHVRFQNEKGLWLTIADNGMPDGSGLGGPRCVFEPIVKSHNQVHLKGHIGHLGFFPDGHPKNAKETGTGEHGTFTVHHAA